MDVKKLYTHVKGIFKRWAVQTLFLKVFVKLCCIFFLGKTGIPNDFCMINNYWVSDQDNFLDYTII